MAKKRRLNSTSRKKSKSEAEANVESESLFEVAESNRGEKDGEEENLSGKSMEEEEGDEDDDDDFLDFEIPDEDKFLDEEEEEKETPKVAKKVGMPPPSKPSEKSSGKPELSVRPSLSLRGRLKHRSADKLPAVQKSEEDVIDWSELDEGLAKCREDFSQNNLEIRMSLDFPHRPTLNLPKYKKYLYIVVDTNIFIHQLAILENLMNEKSLKKLTIFYIPWVVILEIEHLMQNEDQIIRRKAQIANSFLLSKLRDITLNLKTQTPMDNDACDGPSNEDKILQACLSLDQRDVPVILYTNDRDLRIKVSKTSTVNLKAFSSKEFVATGPVESLSVINEYHEDTKKVPTPEESQQAITAMNDIWVYIAKFTDAYAKKYDVELDQSLFTLSKCSPNIIDTFTTSIHLKSLAKLATNLELQIFQCLKNYSTLSSCDERILLLTYCLETAFEHFEIPFFDPEFHVPKIPKLRPMALFNFIKDEKVRGVLDGAHRQIREMKRVLHRCTCRYLTRV